MSLQVLSELGDLRNENVDVVWYRFFRLVEITEVLVPPAEKLIAVSIDVPPKTMLEPVFPRPLVHLVSPVPVAPVHLTRKKKILKTQCPSTFTIQSH